MRQKRVATIQDISCFGRCSLTVALPIISAAGIETCGVPTAVLSTHTGGIQGFTYKDLTDQITPIADHWQSLGLEFDALYTGYLGSFEQIDLMKDFFHRFKGPDTKILIDPVMADNGVLYGGFSEDFPAGMAELCGMADIIVPNLTEAALMLGEEYLGGGYKNQVGDGFAYPKEGEEVAGAGYDRDYIEGLVRRLAKLGPKQVVVTGISFEPEKLGAVSYDADLDQTSYYFNRKIEGYYHGTGDVFASALCAAIVNGKTIERAVEIAVDYTVGCIARTASMDVDHRFGVNFDAGLGEFAQIVK